MWANNVYVYTGTHTGSRSLSLSLSLSNTHTHTHTHTRVVVVAMCDNIIKHMQGAFSLERRRSAAWSLLALYRMSIPRAGATASPSTLKCSTPRGSSEMTCHRRERSSPADKQGAASVEAPHVAAHNSSDPAQTAHRSARPCARPQPAQGCTRARSVTGRAGSAARECAVRSRLRTTPMKMKAKSTLIMLVTSMPRRATLYSQHTDAILRASRAGRCSTHPHGCCGVMPRTGEKRRHHWCPGPGTQGPGSARQRTGSAQAARRQNAGDVSAQAGPRVCLAAGCRSSRPPLTAPCVCLGGTVADPRNTHTNKKKRTLYTGRHVRVDRGGTSGSTVPVGRGGSSGRTCVTCCGPGYVPAQRIGGPGRAVRAPGRGPHPPRGCSSSTLARRCARQHRC